MTDFPTALTIIQRKADREKLWQALHDTDEDRSFGTGMFSLHAEWDFAWARRDYDWNLSLDNKHNRAALEKHRRFFEMLAQAFGMILKGWGPERHVDWEGAAW